MRTRLLLATAFAAWAVAAAHAWPLIPPRGDPARPAPTLDQLIDRLAEVRAKETELQSQRADLERQVRDKLGEQARRLQAVGAPPAGGIALPLFPTVTLPDADLGLTGSKVGEGAPGTATPHAVPSTLPLPTIALPAPVSPVHEPASTVGNRDPQPGWPPPAEWENRLDALGGLPLEYTRWLRDTTPRRATEPGAFYFGAGLFGGN